VSGFLFLLKPEEKWKNTAILAVVPLMLTFGVYDLWVHRIEYGNFTGKVAEAKTVPFEFENKEGMVITNASLEGKVVLFDFWFINCGPCWVKFPNLQELHEKYASRVDFEVFAVNRPMRNDEPNELFTSIEEEGYTFPVLRGTQEMMDAFDVYVYPTVVLLNKDGKVVFMGEIEKAEELITDLL
jgi:thiol-disulfide isomerase/thioredoxin